MPPSSFQQGPRWRRLSPETQLLSTSAHRRDLYQPRLARSLRHGLMADGVQVLPPSSCLRQVQPRWLTICCLTDSQPVWPSSSDGSNQSVTLLSAKNVSSAPKAGPEHTPIEVILGDFAACSPVTATGTSRPLALHTLPGQARPSQAFQVLTSR